MQKFLGGILCGFWPKKIAFFEISQKNTFSTEKRFLTLIYIKTHKRILAGKTQHFLLCVLIYIKVKNRFSVENVFFWEISKNAIFLVKNHVKSLPKHFAFFEIFRKKNIKKNIKKNKINKKI